MSAAPRLSLAIPVYNEREVLPELLSRVRGALDKVPGGPHEIVLVDDGSSDGTVEMLEAAAREDPRIVAVCLSRNFGHQMALTAAFDHVTGDVVVAMDGDLQDPPEVIPQLLAKHAEGYDVVYVRRGQRQESWRLRLAYALFYRLVAALSDLRLPLDSGDFALLSRRVVDAMRQAPERQRYLRGLRTWAGFRQTGITVDRPARHAGRSKYTPLKLLKLAADGIFAFSIYPLRLALVLGAVAIAASLVYAVYAVVGRFLFDTTPQGFTTLVVAIIFSSGVQLVLLGVVGEYVGRIYEEVKGRPHYIVGKIVRGK
ncbi:MAG: glycosyltransferase family 2 protein [Planctomycetia bacterium]|nr:glycosyltransferase family 2 protein [Planctomycetia bacterium]